MPNGFGGVMSAVSGVFFAYIGFDAVSTLAEESENPQRDLPRGMIYSLIICTVVFIILCLVLTGMASYTLLGVSDPLAEIFKLKGVKWMLFIVSIAAVVAMSSVLLVFQMGQPRIWMTMSRDGLLPKRFASIHPKYKTPGFSTIVTGFVVGLPLFFTDEKFVLDFTSIGTLFAFVLVCGGVLMLEEREQETQQETKAKFKLYINAKFIMPALFIFSIGLLFYFDKNYISNLFDITPDNAQKNIPMLVFLLLCIILSVFSFIKNLSLIPILGLLSCCYLLTGMEAANWKWFSTWLAIGLVVYFSYGYRKSKLTTLGQ
jgi:amino acid transporter